MLPFEASRNIDAQGIILLLAGIAAWLFVLVRIDQTLGRLKNFATLLIGIFIGLSFLSLIVNPHLDYGLLGAPNVRLGALAFLACFGCGLVVATIPKRQFSFWLYALILLIAVVSVPYSVIKFGSLNRLAGVFAQADIMAVFLGCGLLLGLYILSAFPAQRNYIIASQFFLAMLLGFTGTRAVMLLTVVLLISWQYQKRGKVFLRQWPMYLASLILALTVLILFSPNRFANIQDATNSINYRIELQKQALTAATERPLWGYGPGNLADALDCGKMSAPLLQQSCRDG